MTKAEPTQQLHDFGMHRRKADFRTPLPRPRAQSFLSISCDLGHHFFDPGRVNATVQNKPLHGFTRDFAAHVGQSRKARPH